MNIKTGQKKIGQTMALLLLITAAVITCLPPVDASDIPTYARLIVTPNPAGLDQWVSAKFWLDNAPPGAGGATGNRFVNFTLAVKYPDGTTETLGPYTSDAAGTAAYSFKPDQLGTYTFQFSFLGQTFGANYHKPSKSNPVNLTVQAEATPYSPDYPLPTEYWNRPINAENRQWYQISGNWLMQSYNVIGTFGERGVYAPYTQSPGSAHIVWTKELTFGGIAGGEQGYGAEYYGGLSYEHKLSPPVIINGRLYYNQFPNVGVSAVPLRGTICVDVRTGEEIWNRDDMVPIKFGQVFNYESPNQHGSAAYLWSTNGTNWYMYDAYSGELLVTFQNATVNPGSYNVVYGPEGEVLAYNLDGRNNLLYMWNSTLAIPNASTGWYWRPGGTSVLDWKNGIQWNVSVPDVPGTQSLQQYSYDDKMIIAEATIAGDPFPTFVDVGYDAETGKQVWVQNRTDLGWGIGGSAIPGLLGFGNTQPREGIYAFLQEQTMQWHAIDINTGKEVWKTQPLDKFTNSSWSIYDWPANIANGLFYTMGESGCVTAFDAATGDHLWTFSVGTTADTPSGTWPIFGGSTIADGKLYVTTGGHFPSVPMDRGNRIYCLNATTGELLWSVAGWYVGANLAIADGYITVYNAYDNRIYGFGKGQTTTTVSAPDTASTMGQSIMIRGTVTDQSPGANNTPAISDKSMSSWMEYLYMQKPKPADATGVTVTLDVLDSNGNYRNIGTTTSDANGFYSLAWKPDITGEYTVYATFAGSESYWASSAVSSFVVDESPATPTPEPVPLTEQYFMPSVMAIIITIIIVGIALSLLILKRK